MRIVIDCIHAKEPRIPAWTDVWHMTARKENEVWAFWEAWFDADPTARQQHNFMLQALKQAPYV
jgi:hypothetical protein